MEKSEKKEIKEGGKRDKIEQKDLINILRFGNFASFDIL